MIVILFFIGLFLSSEVTRVIGILGGYDVNIEQVPHHVNYGDICGGVLLQKNWVLTVAHCGFEVCIENYTFCDFSTESKTDKDYIRVGSKYRVKGPKIKIKGHFLHPLYKKHHAFDYDLQLLETHRALRFGKTVKNIGISDGEYGDFLYISGWGYSVEKGEYREILQQVRIKLVDFESCQGVEQPWYNDTLTSRMFCAGDRRGDACQGDSGGGAVSYSQLIGVSSFGFGCGRDIPGVYINVSRHDVRTWIRQYTGI